MQNFKVLSFSNKQVACVDHRALLVAGGGFHLSAPSSYSVLITAFGHMNMQLSAHQTSPVQNL